MCGNCDIMLYVCVSDGVNGMLMFVKDVDEIYVLNGIDVCVMLSVIECMMGDGCEVGYESWEVVSGKKFLKMFGKMSVESVGMSEDGKK